MGRHISAMLGVLILRNQPIFPIFSSIFVFPYPDPNGADNLYFTEIKCDTVKTFPEFLGENIYFGVITFIKKT